MLKASKIFAKTKFQIGLALIIIISMSGFLFLTNKYSFVGLYSNSSPKLINKQRLLESQFESFKDNYIDSQFHRTIDKQRNGITTSEGQSYTLLRSVWINDHETFKNSWEWTKNNLQREDKLFSWLWGENPNGVWGIIESQGGQNIATDADIDIALALIFAANQWDDDKYLNEAKEIIDSIWEKTVVKLNGNYLLLPNDLEKTAEKDYYLVNPSYFSPAHYRIFAKYDSNNNWMKLADDSYKYLQAFQEIKISSKDSPKLPPNWIILKKETLKILESGNPDLNTNYSYDALRIPFRVGLDWKWFKTDESKVYLSKLTPLIDSYNKNEAIFAEYSRDGNPIVDYESKSMYGASLPIFSILQKNNGKDIVNNKILSDYNFEDYTWKSQISYYDDNWTWFGLAFYLDQTKNIE